MATPITKTVGATSRQYATPQLLEDAFPADITSTDETWTGEMYNDAEFTTKTLFSGTTTDATRWIKLTTASGESFIDHADKLTNALAYDQSKGVGISLATGYQVLMDVRDNYVTVEKIQCKRTATTNNAVIDCTQVTVTGVELKNLITHQSACSQYGVMGFSSGVKLINSLVITESTDTGAVFTNNGMESRNVTAVHPSGTTNTGTGFTTQYSNNIAKNCTSFGFTTDYSASGWDTTNSSHNASDGTGNPGGNSQDSKTFADQFETVTTSGMDFRVKSGSDLENNGTRDAANTNDLDIIGQTRSLTTPTIGCWEFIAVGGTNVLATTDALTLTEQSATVNAETNISAITDTLAITEYAATINAETNVQAGTDALTLTEQQATVNAEINVQTAVDALTLTEYTATITLVTGVNVLATTDALTLTEQTATVNAARNVQASTDTLILTELAATVSIGLKDVQIDGANRQEIASNYGDITLYFNGSNYFTI